MRYKRKRKSECSLFRGREKSNTDKLGMSRVKRDCQKQKERERERHFLFNICTKKTKLSNIQM